MEVLNFQNKDIRTIESGGDTWYSVVDIIAILSNANSPRKYWSDLKNKLSREGSQVSEDIGQFKLEASDGKMRSTDCLNREGILRLIQSIPSPNAEPFKMWLANAGEQNIQEVENPELLIEKFYDHYKGKGMSDDWISTRIRSVETRKELTNRWQMSGVTSSRDFAFLTNIISRGTFNLSVAEHKKLKGLAQKHNIRDNMTTMELVYMILAEVSAKEISEKSGAQGYAQNEQAARQAGEIAGESRKRFEQKTGLNVVSPKNNLLD